MAVTVEFHDLPEVAPLGYCATMFTSGRSCARWATRTMRVGCQHEHVKTQRLCDACTTKLLNGQSWCKLCNDLPEQGHRCYLMGKIIE